MGLRLKAERKENTMALAISENSLARIAFAFPNWGVADSVRIPSGGSMTIDDLETRIQNAADSLGVPVKLERGEVKVGMLFNAVKDPCIIIKNPDFNYDYWQFVVTLQKQAGYAFVHGYITGTSRQLGLSAHQIKSETTVSEKINAVDRGLFAGKKRRLLENEINYYHMVSDVINSL